MSKYEGNKGMIFGILEAHDGSIWFGTMVDGVCRYDGKAVSYFKRKDAEK
jgi:ligand-binding sensor domain-containing protein